MFTVDRDELKQLIKEAIREVFSEIGNGTDRKSEKPAATSDEQPTPKQRPQFEQVERKPQPHVYRPEGFTSAPVAAGTKERPEFFRVADVQRLFGISRRSLYNLIEERKVESKVIRPRGQIRGIRLVSYDSVKAYIESFGAEGSRPESLRTRSKAQ